MDDLTIHGLQAYEHVLTVLDSTTVGIVCIAHTTLSQLDIRHFRAHNLGLSDNMLQVRTLQLHMDPLPQAPLPQRSVTYFMPT